MKRNVFCKYAMVVFAVALFGLLASACDGPVDPKKTDRCIEKVDNALKKGDFSKAYKIADKMIGLPSELFVDNEKITQVGRDLNRKTLINEIAANVKKGNSARIISCIKERAKFNTQNSSYGEEIKMLKHAVQLAKAVGNADLAQSLQDALDTWE